MKKEYLNKNTNCIKHRMIIEMKQKKNEQTHSFLLWECT